HVGRDTVEFGDLVDAGQVVVDGAHHAHGALAVVAGDLQRHVHHAARVDRVIRRVQDAALDHFVPDRVADELVVGRAADDLELEAGQGLLVDGAAQGARRVHVGGDVVDVVRGHGLGAVLGHGLVD